MYAYPLLRSPMTVEHRIKHLIVYTYMICYMLTKLFKELLANMHNEKIDKKVKHAFESSQTFKMGLAQHIGVQ